MKVKLLMSFLVSIMVLTLVATACTAEPTTTTPATQPKGKFTWRFQSVSVEGDYLFQTSKAFGRLVEEATGGVVEVETYPMGALVDIADCYTSLKTGAIEAAIVIPAFAADECPSLLTAELPYAPGDAYQLWEIFNTWGLNDIYEEEYAAHGVHLVVPAYGGRAYVGTTVPINTVEDFKGKPFFLVGGQMFLQKLGVVQTDIPGFDYYSGLKLGTVVGTTQAINFLETQKLMEVDKYYIKTAEIVAAGHILISKKAWDAIGPEMQMRIQDHVEANLFTAFLQHIAGEIASEEKARQYGLTFVTLPAAEEAKVKAAAWSDLDSIAAKSSAAAKAVRLLKDWIAYNNILARD